MGLFSCLSSSNTKKPHRPAGSDRRPPKNVHIGDFHPNGNVNGSREPPHLPYVPSCYQSRKQEKIQVFHREAQELYKEAFYDVTLKTATDYPCTQNELNASGVANRQMDLSKYRKNPTKWFIQPNNGPFVDARIAAREVFDRNDPKRTPSAAEDEAISRLITGFQDAGKRTWGPDLAIKAFCDLDKVFFCGRLKGHAYLDWRPDHYFETACYATTGYIGQGKCLIQLNAHRIFFIPTESSGFVQMFATLLHEMCHAYENVRALDHGHTGWQVGRPDSGHGKNFGTMIYAVNRRAKELLDFKWDSEPYMRHDYAYDDDPRPAPRQPPPRTSPPYTPPSYTPPPNIPPLQRPTASRKSHKSRQELRDDAFRDVSLDSGTYYTCTQSDLDATGGLARQEYPDNDREGRRASQKKWFPQPNHGPFTSPRQACREIFEHNDLRRKPSNLEWEAIERIYNAITAGYRGSWGPDLIIKAFCDLDLVFFRGRLRGHVCVRWLPDWSAPGVTDWGTTIYLGEGKCAIRMNADTILMNHLSPLERMFATMLHEMCHADAHTQVIEGEMLKCASHGRNFGTRLYAVDKRAQKLFNFSLIGYPSEVYPRHEYEKGEGFP